jgi:hypothetical protein
MKIVLQITAFLVLERVAVVRRTKTCESHGAQGAVACGIDRDLHFTF